MIRNKVMKALRYAVLILSSLTTLFPVLWVLLCSFRDNTQIYTKPFALPDPIVSGNFSRVFKSANLLLTFGNSMLYSAVTVVVVILIAAMVSFYLSKFQRKQGLLYLYFIAGIMVPVQAILIPLFVTTRSLGLLNTAPGIIIVYIVTNLSFGIFVLTGFMRKGVPDEMIEAAILDGCGPIRTFFSIALPISQTAVATVGTFVFLGVWNEFLFALVMLADPKLRTLNLSIFMLRGQYVSDQGLMAAGILVLITPAILVYILFQEKVVQGLTAGAVKG
jgi:ABC-type glycerol-3-phosphate transport system permease component